LTEVKMVTTVKYVGAEGREYDKKEDAEHSFKVEKLAVYLYEKGGMYYPDDADSLAELMLEDPNKIKELLGF